MNKSNLIGAITFIFSILCYGQKTLNTPLSSSQIVVDPISISLSPGFYFSSTSGEFRAFIDSNYYPSDGSPSPDQNYVKTTIYKGANATNPSHTVTYFDGLGRPIQKVDNAQSNTGKDIVTHIEYDTFGRQVKDFLPYAAATADILFKTSAATDVVKFYNKAEYDDTTNPFSQKELEASPLNRVLKQASPGNTWTLGSGKEIKFDYQANSDTDAVKLFKVINTVPTNGVYGISINSTTNYPANELYKTITKDENWTSGNNNTTEEFKDKEGHVVLKRTYSDIKDATGNVIEAQAKHDTYYVYDIYGNLTYVIPPLANGAFDQVTLDGLCYQYKYDDRNRLVEKKLPGKQWEFIIYDKLDRVVATGPALSPFSDSAGTNGWLITKYDNFNRPVLTAWHEAAVTSDDRSVLQNSANAMMILSEGKTATTTTINGVEFNYSTAAWPTSNYHVLTVNYYDDYVFPHAETIPTAVLGQNVYYNNTLKPKGLPTGSWIRITETSTTYNAEKGITYYDYKARPIQVKTFNHLGGYTQLDSQLDFIGKTLLTETRHKRRNSDAEILTKEEFTYSAQDRLVTHTHQINNGVKQLLVKNSYDELGQLIGKNVGGTDATGSASLQKVDYKYNIRGWLKEINDINNLTLGANPKDLFAFKINYNDNQTSGLPASQTAVAQLFNGNISETLWKTANDDKIKKYGYQYDHLNRLSNAIYQDPYASIVTNSYNESLTYDKNGNINTLIRKNYQSVAPFNLTMDNLSYTYDANIKNQLKKVDDTSGNTSGFKNGINSGDDYGYDANGNMTLDKNKGITAITYNHLNLPTKIVFENADLSTSYPKVIEYKYNAQGNKIEKKVYEPKNLSGTLTNTITKTNYIGNYVYQNDILQFFSHPEGYVAYSSSNSPFSYVFQYKDHLGNVRLSYTDSNKDGLITGATTDIFYDGFETASGWNSLVQGNSTYSTLITSYDSTIKNTGNYSGKIEKLTTGEKVVQKDNWTTINNTSPTTYIYSAWVYSNGPSADLCLFQNTAAEIGYVTKTDYISTTEINKWVYIEKRVTVQPDITKLNIRIDNNGGGTVWFDDISIRRVNPTNEIIEENNYYAFGLKHSDNNNLITGNGNSLAQKYKYQGQERQDELGLNWDSFKWRNYSPDLGRFWSIDPLSEKYVYNGVYNFSENRVIDGRELEGLEWESIKNQDGTTTRQLTVQMYNNAGISEKQLTKLQENLKENFSKSFTGEGATGNLVIQNVTETKGDFLVTLQDTKSYPVYDKETQEVIGKTYLGGKTGELGQTQKNSFDLSVSVDGSKRANSDISRSFNHESGHTAGLEHPWEKSNPVLDIRQGTSKVEDSTVKKNLMNSADNTNVDNRSNSGMSLTSGQFKSMDELIKKQQ